jgi:hypothetical protein
MRIEEADVAMTKTLFFGGVFFNVLYTLRVAAARLCCCLRKIEIPADTRSAPIPPELRRRKLIRAKEEE